MNKQRAFFLCLAYGSVVALSELTLGNADFPIHLWYFDSIPAAYWSVPVHFGGLVLTVFLQISARSMHGMFAFFGTWLYFILLESANFFSWRLFQYSTEPAGRIFSWIFIIVILYGSLCLFFTILWRLWVQKRQ